MSRIRLILLAALAVVAVSALASASASAAACEKESGTGKFVLCLGNPLVLTTGTLTIHIETDGTGGYKLLTTSVGVTCTQVTGLGLIDSGQGNVTVLSLRLSFSTPTTKCVVSVTPGCQVAEPITTLPLSGVEDPPAKEKEKILFLPATGTEFALIKFENKAPEECLIAGSDKVSTGKEKGGVLCTSPIETTRLLQLFTCLKANSSLEFKKEAATFEGTFNTKLLSSNVATEWAVVEGK